MTEQPHNAMIFGATGMVGIEVLHNCLSDSRIAQVVTIGRNKTGVSHRKLQEIEHTNFRDFSNLHREFELASLCFYCIGVYQGKVPEAQFWEITCDYLDNLIKALEQAKKDITFCLFSAQGADRSEKSKFLFARAKGQAERNLLKSGLSKKYIFRPGYIHPGRKSADSRIPSWLVAPFYRMFPSIGIDAPDLAAVMVRVGLEKPDQITWENRDMQQNQFFNSLIPWTPGTLRR